MLCVVPATILKLKQPENRKKKNSQTCGYAATTHPTFKPNLISSNEEHAATPQQHI
jgi:hypothetical protein